MTCPPGGRKKPFARRKNDSPKKKRSHIHGGAEGGGGALSGVQSDFAVFARARSPLSRPRSFMFHAISTRRATRDSISPSDLACVAFAHEFTIFRALDICISFSCTRIHERTRTKNSIGIVRDHVILAVNFIMS